jgi:hypothetical protein
MDVISWTSHAIAFAAGVSGYRGEVGVKRGSNGRIEDRCAVFGAKHYMDENT